MVIERGDGAGEQPQFNVNEDMATMMATMQARLEEQSRVIEQQAALIHNFQQHQVGPGGVQQPPLVRPEPLCDRFCKMKPKAFEGSIDPLDVEEWLSSIQVIVEFMELNDQERIICASYMMKKEARYWWSQLELEELSPI